MSNYDMTEAAAAAASFHAASFWPFFINFLLFVWDYGRGTLFTCHGDEAHGGGLDNLRLSKLVCPVMRPIVGFPYELLIAWFKVCYRLISC